MITTIRFLVAMLTVMGVVVFVHLRTADFPCQLCGHPNAERWKWLVIARRCRTCDR